MKPFNVVHRGTLLTLVPGSKGSQIVRKGVRLAEPIPEPTWGKILNSRAYRAGFECPRCREPVFNETRQRLQTCRCTAIRQVEFPFFETAPQWSEWQMEFDRQSMDPIPDHYFSKPFRNTEGCLPDNQIRINDAGKAWLRRRFGLAADIQIDDDGHTLRTASGDGHLEFCDDGVFLYRGSGDQKNEAELCVAADNVFATRGSVPGLIVTLGWDEGYVWPSMTLLDHIEPLPFRCGGCTQRVKRAPNLGGWVLLCWCCGAFFPHGSCQVEPRSRLEWDVLRLQAEAGRVRAEARAAKGQS